MFGMKVKVKASEVAWNLVDIKKDVIESVNKSQEGSQGWQVSYPDYRKALDIHVFLLTWYAIWTSKWSERERKALSSELMHYWSVDMFPKGGDGFEKKVIAYTKVLQSAILEYNKRQDAANKDKKKEDNPLIVLTAMVGYFSPANKDNDLLGFTNFLFMMIPGMYEPLKDFVHGVQKKSKLLI